MAETRKFNAYDCFFFFFFFHHYDSCMFIYIYSHGPTKSAKLIGACFQTT